MIKKSLSLINNFPNTKDFPLASHRVLQIRNQFPGLHFCLALTAWFFPPVTLILPGEKFDTDVYALQSRGHISTCSKCIKSSFSSMRSTPFSEVIADYKRGGKSSLQSLTPLMQLQFSGQGYSCHCSPNPAVPASSKSEYADGNFRCTLFYWLGGGHFLLPHLE
ncbi:MAG: hypothetical protein CM15mP71_0960 [Candidatus Poseidoniales archaeon]|nr:MAG: hypothetical protein CM15mP71_0960 [Candidatus Poseidoniales archaeon]